MEVEAVSDELAAVEQARRCRNTRHVVNLGRDGGNVAAALLGGHEMSRDKTHPSLVSVQQRL